MLLLTGWKDTAHAVSRTDTSDACQRAPSARVLNRRCLAPRAPPALHPPNGGAQVPASECASAIGAAPLRTQRAGGKPLDALDTEKLANPMTGLPPEHVFMPKNDPSRTQRVPASRLVLLSSRRSPSSPNRSRWLLKREGSTL